VTSPPPTAAPPTTFKALSALPIVASGHSHAQRGHFAINSQGVVASSCPVAAGDWLQKPALTLSGDAQQSAHETWRRPFARHADQLPSRTQVILDEACWSISTRNYSGA
jgi:hypothetical protein